MAPAADGEALYDPVDTHRNEAGNHLAGRTVAGELRGRGLPRSRHDTGCSRGDEQV